MLSRLVAIVLMTLLCVALMTEAAVGKTKGRMKAGGWRKVNVTDPEVQAVAAKATAHLERARNSAKVYRLHEVASAKVQIVRGKNFKLALKIGQTNCFRRANVDVNNCSIVKVERCAVTVLVWQNTSEVTNFTCGKEKNVSGGGGGKKPTRKPVMPGGEMDIDVTRGDVIEAATFATAELTSRSNGRYTVQHQRITKATSQVVAGAMYRLTLEVAVTSSGENKAKTTRCNVQVWDQAWRTPRYILEEYKCNRLIS